MPQQFLIHFVGKQGSERKVSVFWHSLKAMAVTLDECQHLCATICLIFSAHTICIYKSKDAVGLLACHKNVLLKKMLSRRAVISCDFYLVAKVYLIVFR